MLRVEIPQRLLDSVEVREHLAQDVRRWSVPITTTRSAISAETRADTGDDETLVIEGYAAVFDSDSLPIYGMFVERIKRGAFKNTLASDPDVRLLVNHTGLPYARTTNGTLTVSEKPKGLHYRATLAPTDESESLHTLIDRGDVNQNSFAFRIAKNGDEWSCACGDTFGEECYCHGEDLVRTITEIAECPEVSVVTFPAYPATSVTVARDSEPEGERVVQACDGEQHAEAPSEDASIQRTGSDHAEAIRSWLVATGSNNESCTNRSTGAC